MTKDVLVSVRGIHTAEADGDTGSVEWVMMLLQES